MSERRKFVEIADDMEALWDMPDQDEAKRLAPELLREALQRIVDIAEERGDYVVDWKNVGKLARIIEAFDTLMDGVRYE